MNSNNPEKMSDINKSPLVDIEFKELSYAVKGECIILLHLKTN